MSLPFAPTLVPESVPIMEVVTNLIGTLEEVRGALSADAAPLLEQALRFARQSELTLRHQEDRIRKLESLSLTDPLTGLLNRRGFEEAMDRTLASCRRHGDEGVLAYIDLDGFKQVNDTFGHAAGDAILQHAAAILTRMVRATDYVARLGGDEFAVIFTNTVPQAGKSVLAKLRRNLNGGAIRIEGRLVQLRASIGTEGFGQLSDFGGLLNAADRNMYRVKQRRSAKAA